MIYEITHPAHAAALFDGWEETIVWSCLQGVMGRIYATDINHPVSAMATLGDFAFFAGEVNSELIAYKPGSYTQDFIIMIGQNTTWLNAITAFYGEKARVVSRYAFQKESGIFDRSKLQKFVSALPPGYRMDLIDEPLYRQCRSQAWSADLVSQFRDYEEYRRLGLGAVICKDGVIVSGASSYSRYREGIEIEIDTRKDYRRKGLATICGAKLILECLKRNLYPSWDAQNLWSVSLAEKLGYHYSHTYTAVEIWGY
ncbi:MAG: GNAT family N-acetyltransferase [Eubacterium sp.]|nr:GNAT family N-acetyltransferase [Eubacterium sp.]